MTRRSVKEWLASISVGSFCQSFFERGLLERSPFAGISEILCTLSAPEEVCSRNMAEIDAMGGLFRVQCMTVLMICFVVYLFFKFMNTNRIPCHSNV
ncbi:hypothetical protein NPIL_583531 [Nephila pilipes]|uniref:Uncharacterized protein n=1 Tax=Nephila pilipes TaxID=299642 RepID=A0A8X6Q608_NEPPI|nr:hypothetical protein NPIL_583531 [Nephila pilipes]